MNFFIFYFAKRVPGNIVPQANTRNKTFNSLKLRVIKTLKIKPIILKNISMNLNVQNKAST